MYHRCFHQLHNTGIKNMASKFDKMVNKLKSEKHPPKDPKAVAAAIGRKKYGSAGMAKKAAAGRKGK